MLFLFDIDGTLVRSYLREDRCATCKGAGQVPIEGSKFRGPCDSCSATGVAVNQAAAYDEIELLPNRLRVISELRAAGHDVALVTNQGGVAFGYQTLDQVEKKMVAVLQEIEMGPVEYMDGSEVWTMLAWPREKGDVADAPTLVYMSLGHPRAKLDQYRTRKNDTWRKPGGGMIKQAMKDYGAKNAETVFVGDMDSDHAAAIAAGVHYSDATEFFENEAVRAAFLK